MSSGYCTKLCTEHCSIIRIVLCGTTFTLLKKRCQCFVDAPMLRSHRRQRPLTDNKEKPQPHCKDLHADLCSNHSLFDKNMVVTSNEMEDIIKDLSYNKSPGLDGICSEHMKFAGQHYQSCCLY